MSAQKRSTNLLQDSEEVALNQSYRRRRSKRSRSRRLPALQFPQQQEIPNEQQQIQDQPFLCDKKSDEKNSQKDSDGSGTDPEDFDRVIRALQSQKVQNNDFNERDFFAELFEARNVVECPICLGIIKKTRTVMGCFHRFCKECIDKSIRLGNHKCPVCRTRCASRRSLRDDPLFDTLINALYPEAEKYEEEELLSCKEDKTWSKQIQASIAEVSILQQEASIPSHRLDTDADESPSEDSEDSEERIRQRSRRRRRRRRTRISPAITSPVLNQEIIGWGRRGTRSRT